LTRRSKEVDLAAPTTTPRVVTNDIDDDHVIAAAVAARADFTTPGDRHLLTLRSHQGIRIITPAEALQVIKH
jgi:uncharacterized protein